MKQTLAIFDFDGTLSKGECGLRFFRYLLGHWSFVYFLFHNLVWILLYLSKLADEYALNKITGSVFKGRKRAEVAELAEKFAREIMPRHLYPQVMERLDWHQKQGHRCLIITRAFDLYMRPWAKQLDLGEMFATQLEESSSGLFTGKIANHSYVGKQKLVALYELVGEPKNFLTYAYADSASDRYLLATADYAYWIRNPQAELEKALVDAKLHQRWKKRYRLES